MAPSPVAWVAQVVPVETDSMACKVPQVLLSLPQPLARTVPTVWMVPLVPQPVLPQSQVVLDGVPHWR